MKKKRKAKRRKTKMITQIQSIRILEAKIKKMVKRAHQKRRRMGQLSLRMLSFKTIRMTYIMRRVKS